MFSKFFKALSPSKKTAYLAIFLAFSVVVNALGITFSPSNKITFTYTVCFFAGYLLGAIPAFLVGFLGDCLSFLLNPDGIFFLFGVTLGLYGFLMGIFTNCLPFHGKRGGVYKAIIAFVIGYLLITVVVNSLVNYWYVILFVWQGEIKKGFLIYFIGRIGWQSIVYAVNVVVSLLAIPLLDSLKRRVLK